MDRRISSCFVHPVAKLVITYEKKTPTATKLIFWLHQSSCSVKTAPPSHLRLNFHKRKYDAFPLGIVLVHTYTRETIYQRMKTCIIPDATRSFVSSVSSYHRPFDYRQYRFSVASNELVCNAACDGMNGE